MLWYESYLSPKFLRDENGPHNHLMVRSGWIKPEHQASPDLKFFEVFKQTPFKLYAQEMSLQEWPEGQRELCSKRFTAVLSSTVGNQ